MQQLPQQQTRILIRNKGLLELPKDIEESPDAVAIEASNNSLISIPASIGVFSSITSLRLFGNSLRSLPQELGFCTTLTSLNLGKNRFSTLPECITELKLLQDLELSHNRLNALSGSIGKLTSLTTLDLSYNKLTDLPADMCLLTNLQNLNLDFNNLIQIPFIIYKIDSLESLSANSNGLNLFAGDSLLSSLKKLRRIELRNNKITTIPTEIGTMTALNSLIVSHNRLKILPEQISALTMLTELVVNNNVLESLPSSLGNCVSLKKIIADHNRLSSLDFDVTNIKNLVDIDMRHNMIKRIHKSFCSISSCFSLHLGHNLLDDPDCIPVNASDLHIEFNRLRELPKGLLNVKPVVSRFACCANMISSISPTIAQWGSKLTLLDFSMNNIETLPEEIGELSCLASLNVSANRLKSLPDVFDKIKSLQLLLCGYNTLKDLPPSIGSLVSLRFLRAPGNCFTKVPSVLCSHPSLSVLDLANNNISGFETEATLPLLTGLDLSMNKLSDISALGKVTTLKSLNLSRNAFTAFPAAVFEMKNLATLDLSGNQLTCIPKEAGKLRELNRFNMSCNRLGFDTISFVSSLDKDGYAPSPSEQNSQVFSGNPYTSSPPNVSNTSTIPSYALFPLDILPGATHIRLDGNMDIDKLVVLPADISTQEEVLKDGSGPVSLSFGWSEMCGMRSEMQDSTCLFPNFQELPKQFLAGLYDGHSGCRTSMVVCKRIPTVLSSALYKQKNPLTAIKSTYELLHDDLSMCGEGDGTAALTTLLRCNTLFVANTGDSRAVLCRSGRAIELTHDHKPTDQSEIARIEKCGGFVSCNGRVNGVLSLSRAIGDEALQPYVTWEPDLVEHKLAPNEDEFLIMACDGVWDILSSQEAVSLVRSIRDPGRAACCLRDYAFSLGSGDNISVIIIRFNWKTNS